jgi:undecaprenyl-diphosphatase
MTDWLEIILLGVVEGLTEFLPISSTAHLLLVARVLGFEDSTGGTFVIFIQFGAVIAVVDFYARDLLTQARLAACEPAIQRFWLGILVAFLPAALAGVLLQTWIKTVLFDSPTVIAWALIIGGIVLLLAELLPQRPTIASNIPFLTLRQALTVGMVQVLALISGVSRSGASIVGDMLTGMDRPTATRFSFYLAIPTLGAATVVDLFANLGRLTLTDVGQLLLETLIAFVVAWLSIGWLLRYVARNSFVVFGIYRMLAGAVILVLLGLRQL